MDRRQIGTKLTLDAIGVELSLGTFHDRLIVQKTIYLAQAAGINLGYFFHWYLRGPYCSDLTGDVFAMSRELVAGSTDAEGWALDSASRQRATRLAGLFPTGDAGNRADTLELLASVHFLIDHRQDARDDTRALHATLERYHKDYSLEETTAARQRLLDHGLIVE